MNTQVHREQGWVEPHRRQVYGNALSVRAAARLIAVCAVLAGLFGMHGLPGQGCPGGDGASTPSMAAMAHPAPLAAAPHRPPAAITTSVSRPLVHFVATIGTDGHFGEVCVAIPPPSGWARLLALLVGVSIFGLATVLRSPTLVMHPDHRQRRAPPLTGSTMLRRLCVSRT